ncbi:MAG: hypothetical protein IJF36_06310 [Oscillibacter sp.]|nr:hypothetical protein [Oscillibacter sp.]
MLIQAVLLGSGVAAVHDMLRPFRLRFRRWSSVLDGGYILGVGISAFAFLLRQGGGELRGFLLAGGLGGAALYTAGASQLLQPVWQFWSDTVVELGRIAALPAKALWTNLKKLIRWMKNLFYFGRKCYTIRKIGFQAQFSKGGGRRGKRGKEKGRRRHSDQGRHSGSGRRHRLAAVRSAGAAHLRTGGAGPVSRSGGSPPAGE